MGAYYYPWWGDVPGNFYHWEEGFMGTPLLGEGYNSRDPEVINQHIQWAMQYGIDFFNVSWFGPNKWEDATLKNYFLKSPYIDGIRFAIFIESWGPGGGRFIVNDEGKIDFNDQQNINTLLSDFDYLANTYFGHPSYLKIYGKPVVTFYLAREYSGDYAGAIRQLRDHMKQDKGIDLYIIGDVVYWLENWLGPDTQRISVFDAITSYNMMSLRLNDTDVPHNNPTQFINDVLHIYTIDSQAANQLGVDFIPDAFPGYNDHNMRSRDPNNSIMPRSIDFFRKFVEESRGHIDPDINMFLITTFNEFDENTHVEPTEEDGTIFLELIAEQFD